METLEPEAAKETLLASFHLLCSEFRWSNLRRVFIFFDFFFIAFVQTCIFQLGNLDSATELSSFEQQGQVGAFRAE